MISNNVSAYETEYLSENVFVGKAYLNKDGYFIDGDTEFYHFIGNNSCFKFAELLHPDDVDEVKYAMRMAQQSPQHCMGRIKGKDDKYCFLYFVLSKSDRIIDDCHPLQIEIVSFFGLKEKYMQYADDIRKYRTYMSFVPYYYYEYDFDTDMLLIYQYVNQKCIVLFKEEMKEWKRSVILDQTLLDTEKSELYNFIDRLKSNQQRCQFEVSAKAFPIQNVKNILIFKGALLRNHTGSLKNAGIVETDLSGEDAKCYYLSENAYDPGTGIFNKRAINEYAVEKIKECHANYSSLYLGVMDIDDFKIINDTYGHMFGDEVLARIAEIITSVLDNRGFCGRFGGDEFMIVFDRVDSERELREILKTISKNMYYAFSEKNVHITNSCGISRYPDNGTSLEELFSVADKASYIAKKKGKNRYIIYDQEKHDGFMNEETSIRKAGVHALEDIGKKSSVLTELILDIQKNGKKNMDKILEKIRDYFDIDGIAVYCGIELERIKSSGIYTEPIKKLDCIMPTTYCSLFGEEGVYMESIMMKLKNFYPQLYELFVKQENGKFIQFLAHRDGKPYVLVSFDYFNRSPKIGACDLSLITMIGRIITETYATEEL